MSELPNVAYRMRPLYKGKPLGGWAYVLTVEEVADMLDGADQSAYEIEKCEMTQEQFDTLPDFEGW